MSFAFKTSRLCEPIAEVRARGVMPFAAVGNSGDRTTGTRAQYPAACPDAVGLAHSQEDGSLDPQAQRAAVSLTAPGSEVRSLCARPHTTGVGSGSSFASPAGAASYVAVRAALDAALGPAQAAERAIDILFETADPVLPASHPRGSSDSGRDGFGRINLAAALAASEDVWINQSVPTPTPAGRPAETPTATPCSGNPVLCAAIGTATALARGTATPTPPPTLDPTVAAILTGTPEPSSTPTVPVDPTVAAMLTAIHTPSTPTPEPTPDETEVSALLTAWAPSATPDKYATAWAFRCFVARECGAIYLPRLTK